MINKFLRLKAERIIENRHNYSGFVLEFINFFK